MSAPAIIGGFVKEAPTQCSQLPVARREPEGIAFWISDAFELRAARH
jgi:hypothetical protein